MEFVSETKTEKSLRLTLESLSHLRHSASKAFELRNAKIEQLQASLQLQVVSLIGAIALTLCLGFSLNLHPLLIFSTVFGVAAWVLKLKLKLVRVEKGKKAKEPPVEVGELVATISKGQFQFYRVHRKSTFHFYLIPLQKNEILNNLDFAEPKNQEAQNKKTLFLHKKRVFNHFYKVTNCRETTGNQLSA